MPLVETGMPLVEIHMPLVEIDMPVLEVGMMGVQPGKTPLEPHTADGTILLEAWTSIIAAPGGPERIFWGVEKDDPRRIWAWFEWESLSAHEEFARSFGANATSRFPQVFTPGFTKHARLDTMPLRSRLSLVFLAFFPPTLAQSTQDEVQRRFNDSEDSELLRLKGVEGVSCGWGLESDFPVRGGWEGEQGRVFFALVGCQRGDERVVEVVRGQFGGVVQKEGCGTWDMFWLDSEMLERGRSVHETSL